jgi:ribosomal protein L12E/L44/L45/RPP1/RPP2
MDTAVAAGAGAVPWYAQAHRLLKLLYDKGEQSDLWGVSTVDWDCAVNMATEEAVARGDGGLSPGPPARARASIEEQMQLYSSSALIALGLGALGRALPGLGPMAQYVNLVFPPVRAAGSASSGSSVDDDEEEEEAEEEEEEEEEDENEDGVIGSRPEKGDQTKAGGKKGKKRMRLSVLSRMSISPHARAADYVADAMLRRGEGDASEGEDEEEEGEKDWVARDTPSWLHDPSLTSYSFLRRVRERERVIPLQVIPFILLALAHEAQRDPETGKLAHGNDPLRFIMDLQRTAARFLDSYDVRRENQLAYSTADLNPDERSVAPGLRTLCKQVLPGVWNCIRAFYQPAPEHFAHGSYLAWRTIEGRLRILEGAAAELLRAQEAASASPAKNDDGGGGGKSNNTKKKKRKKQQKNSESALRADESARILELGERIYKLEQALLGPKPAKRTKRNTVRGEQQQQTKR